MRELRPFERVNPYVGSYGAAQAAPVQTIDLRRVMVALRRQRRTILLPAVLLGGLGLAYAAAKPAVYDAYSSLLLDSNVNRSVQQAGGIDNAALPSERIENARVVLESDKLAYDVLDRTGLQDNPSFMNPPQSGFSTAIGQGIGTLLTPVTWLQDRIITMIAPAEVADPADLPQPTAVPMDPSIAPIDPERRLAAMRLRGGIDIFRVGQSSAVAVSYTSHDPVIAAEVANAYADAYLEDIFATNAESVGQTNAWMRTRLNELQQQAQEAANAAERFAAETGLVELSSGGLLTEQALNELNSSLSDATSEAARAQAVLDTYDRAVAGGVEGLTESNSSIAIGGEMSDELRARLDNYNDVRARLQRLLASSPQHPQIAGLRQTLATTAERLFVELEARRAEAQSTLDVANARVETLQRSVDQASQRNSAQAANLVRLRALQEEAATLSALYQQTLTRSQEIEQQQSFPVSNVRILSYAQVPGAPSGPAVMRTALAATLLGLFLGLALAALREWRERSLRTAGDVTDHSGLRFLGHLPVLPRARRLRAPRASSPRPLSTQPTTTPPPLRLTAPAPGAPKGETLPVLSRPRPEVIQVPVPVLQFPNSIYAETLRHVRMAADASGNALPATGVTSFHPYAGRSSVAFNLAGQLGVGLQSVLLIDADSRARTLSRALRLDQKPGLTDAVAGRDDWRGMLVGIANTNLSVLPCGLAGGGTSDDLLTGKLLGQIVADACGEFSRVIIDVPPLYPVAQGRAILHELPQFVIVGDWGRTPRGMVETALAEDPELEDRCLGVVYDRVNLRQLRSFLMPEAMENYLSRSKDYLSMKRR